MDRCFTKHGVKIPYLSTANLDQAVRWIGWKMYPLDEFYDMAYDDEPLARDGLEENYESDLRSARVQLYLRIISNALKIRAARAKATFYQLDKDKILDPLNIGDSEVRGYSHTVYFGRDEEYLKEHYIQPRSVLSRPKKEYIDISKVNFGLIHWDYDFCFASKNDSAYSLFEFDFDELQREFPIKEADVSNLIIPKRLESAHKQICQAVAKTIWDEAPDMTIEEMKRHPAIQEHGFGKYYNGKNTLRDWLREVDPRSPSAKTGRQKKIPV